MWCVYRCEIIVKAECVKALGICKEWLNVLYTAYDKAGNIKYDNILHDVILFFPASPHYVEKQNVFDFDMSENTSIDTLNTTNASLNQQNLSLSSSGNFRPSSISFFSNIIISTQTETGRCEVFAVCCWDLLKGATMGHLAFMLLMICASKGSITHGFKL